MTNLLSKSKNGAIDLIGNILDIGSSFSFQNKKKKQKKFKINI